MSDRDEPRGLWDPTAFLRPDEEPSGVPGRPEPQAPAGPPPPPPPQGMPPPRPPHSMPPPAPPHSMPTPPPPPSAPSHGMPAPGPGTTDPQPPPVTPSSGGPGRLPIMAGVAVAVVLAVSVVLFVALRPNADPAAPNGTRGQAADTGAQTTYYPEPETEQPDTEPTTESTTEEPDPNDAALARLEELYLQDQGGVSFDGQLAAQIASKYPGIRDPLQTTEQGSHVFAAADILAEHERLREEHDSLEHPVVLLKSTDYGKRQLIEGNFLWVTFAVGDFADRQAVLDWCAEQFADLSTAERENQCVVGRLRP